MAANSGVGMTYLLLAFALIEPMWDEPLSFFHDSRQQPVTKLNTGRTIPMLPLRYVIITIHHCTNNDKLLMCSSSVMPIVFLDCIQETRAFTFVELHLCFLFNSRANGICYIDKKIAIIMLRKYLIEGKLQRNSSSSTRINRLKILTNLLECYTCSTFGDFTLRVFSILLNYER